MSPQTSKRDRRPGQNKDINYWRRRAIAVGVAGLTAVTAAEVIPPSITALEGNTIADRLAQPFSVDQTAYDSGKFTPGTVVEVKLPTTPGNKASQMAVALAAGEKVPTGDVPDDEIEDNTQDIVAEWGPQPPPGAEAFLPSGDVDVNKG